jgi:hypothetical protein
MNWTRLQSTGFGIGLLVIVVIFVQALTFIHEAGLTGILNQFFEESILPQSAVAAGTYNATGGSLIVGTEVAGSVSNIPSWRAVLGNDSNTNNGGNYWTTARTAAGLNKQVFFDGVEQQGANKMILTIEDTNITTANAYSHLICDWVSSTDVFLAADSECTGGGWRHLHPLRTNLTSVSDTARVYEIFDGYFWTTSNVAVATPISNFISTTNKRVLIRTHSTVNSAVQHRTDAIQLELAIDPVYEPAGFTTISAGTITNGISNIIGGISTTLNPSDNVRITIPMPAVSQPVDMYFTLANIKTYEGMNSVLISSEMCVSNVSLTFAFYLYNFTDSVWDKGTATTTGSVCNTDTDYAFAINESTIGGFVLEDYIDGSGDMRLRVLTNAPATVYSIQFDRLYTMLGSVVADSGGCELSYGTGTEANCVNTRNIGEAVTGTPGSTWQITSTVEYLDTNAYAQDADDDVTGGEHAFAGNITVPVSVPNEATVTGVHYAAKFRSNITTMTLDPQLFNYSGTTGIGGQGVGAGWVTTPSTDTNAATTYTYADSWRLLEVQNEADKYVHTGKGTMNMRLRTSASTNTTTPTTMNWAFLMMSIRWLETPRQTTQTTSFSPSSGILEVGNTIAIDANNKSSWRATLGNDGSYWTTARTSSGFSTLLYFDPVENLGANKMIVTIEDSNITTANAYEHLVCDWVSSVDVYLPADSNCTGGGWRTLHPRGTTLTNTADTVRTYEVYNGYYWNSSGEVITTPVTNFISSTTKQVIIRSYSTVNSAVRYRVDWAQVEMAIDPIYEPGAFTANSAGTITNGVRELIGAVSTNVTASDGNKMTIPMPAVSQPVDVTFTFNNVKPYVDANTVLLAPELCATNAALQFAFYGFNASSSLWERFTATSTPSVCGTDTTYAFSANSTNVSGFSLANYIQNGQLQIRLLTNAPATLYNMQLDRFYMMIGSVNIDTADCEISWGSGTLGNCVNTRTIGEGTTATPASATWQITNALEYQSSQHSLDNDDDGTNGERAKAANISFPITIATSTQITAMHYAIKFRSNITSETWEAQIRKYGALSGLGNNGVGSGWVNTPGTNINAATTYSYFDTWQIVEPQNDTYTLLDTSNNQVNLRLRTSISSNTGTSVTGDWAFAMASVRYIESRSSQMLSFSISDSTIGFGDLTPGAARYATGDILGSGTPTPAHLLYVSTNAEGGYAVSVSGQTLTSGPDTITAIGSTPTTSQPGTQQFGLAAESVAGAGLVASRYNGSSTVFAFATASFPDSFASGSGTGLFDTYRLWYLANISPQTKAGNYNSVVTYTVTSTY